MEQRWHQIAVSAEETADFLLVLFTANISFTIKAVIRSNPLPAWITAHSEGCDITTGTGSRVGKN
jgi:hypothetical protein